jgi:hypothetical protein
MQPIHAELISKTTLCGSFLNENLHIHMSLLQSQNKPKQQFKSFIQYKTDIHKWASEVIGCQWVTSATQTQIRLGDGWLLASFRPKF